MKKILHKVTSSLLALLVLLSTVSWTVDKHLCMGRVMDVAFFVEADDCGMDAASALLDNDEENHCCDDETIVVEGQDDLKLNWNDFELDQQVLLVAFTAWYSNILLNLSERPVPADTYPPPILVADYTTLYEVYLI